MLAAASGGGSMDAQLVEAMMERSTDATIDAQVRIVAPETFPFTLAYFTGSEEHNIRLRQLAIDKGLRLNEFGLFSEEAAGEAIGMEAAKHTLPCTDEADIYRRTFRRQHHHGRWIAAPTGSSRHSIFRCP